MFDSFSSNKCLISSAFTLNVRKDCQIFKSLCKYSLVINKSSQWNTKGSTPFEMNHKLSCIQILLLNIAFLRNVPSSYHHVIFRIPMKLEEIFHPQMTMRKLNTIMQSIKQRKIQVKSNILWSRATVSLFHKSRH